MIEIILRFILFGFSAFATIAVATHLLLLRKSRSFSAWAGVFLGFFSGSLAQFLRLFFDSDHFSIWILQAAGNLLIAIGFFLVYKANREREVARQHHQRIASRVADTKTMIDPITRLSNRRQFETRAEIEFQRAKAGRKSLSILALRVDDFKGKFSAYGQECADEILRTVATIISSTIREIPRGDDLAARTDSDQFEVLLVGADSSIARGVAFRLLEHIQLNPLNWHNQFIHLNATISYTTYSHNPTFDNPQGIATASAAQLILTAEDTLERACRSGPGKVLQGPP